MGSESIPVVRRVVVERLTEQSLGDLGEIAAPGELDDPRLNRSPGQMAFLWLHGELQAASQSYVATTRYRYRGSRCEYLQRHPASTLLLVPIDGRPSVVFAAPDDEGSPRLDAVKALLVTGDSGLAIKPGVWVRYAYPILDTADFVQVTSRVDASHDYERFDLERSRGLVLEWYFGPPAGSSVQLSAGGAVLGLDPAVTTK